MPYGAPQLDVPVLLNVNENPYPPGEAVVADIAARGRRRRPRRSTGTPTASRSALRADLAAYLTADGGVPLDAEQVWAANGSNEIMLQLLQAFGGPGRTAVSFAPTYSMYPEYARDTHTGWVVGRRADDFSIDLPHALAVDRRAPAVGRAAGLAQQPHRHRAAARRRRGDPAPPRRASSSSTRRTASSAATACRAR